MPGGAGCEAGYGGMLPPVPSGESRRLQAGPDRKYADIHTAGAGAIDVDACQRTGMTGVWRIR